MAARGHPSFCVSSFTTDTGRLTNRAHSPDHSAPFGFSASADEGEHQGASAAQPSNPKTIHKDGSPQERRISTGWVANPTVPILVGPGPGLTVCT
jgi:hypothetical protein